MLLFKNSSRQRPTTPPQGKILSTSLVQTHPRHIVIEVRALRHIKQCLHAVRHVDAEPRIVDRIVALAIVCDLVQVGVAQHRHRCVDGADGLQHEPLINVQPAERHALLMEVRREQRQVRLVDTAQFLCEVRTGAADHQPQGVLQPHV